MLGFVTDPAGRAGLRLARDLPEPVPAPHEFLLDVRGYAINRGELRLIARRPNGWRPGQDVTGIVLRAAEDGSGPPTGARVAAEIDWESWAERVAVPSASAAVLDDRVGFEQAAALPVAGLTALRALRHGGSVLGKNVLVTGATGGVGQFAVPLAVLSGASVTAQVSDPVRTELALSLGAHHVVTSLDEVTTRFSLLLDGVAGPQLSKAVRLLESGGCAVVYGGGAESGLQQADFYGSGVANARLVMGFLSVLPAETKGADLGIVAGLVTQGRLTPAIGWSSDWTETPAALQALARREIRGRAVLLRDAVATT
jgi:NADPH:quinone reductase-like Zn-dependent oxidoreductase